jgi:hypothetical protein
MVAKHVQKDQLQKANQNSIGCDQTYHGGKQRPE